MHARVLRCCSNCLRPNILRDLDAKAQITLGALPLFDHMISNIQTWRTLSFTALNTLKGKRRRTIAEPIVLKKKSSKEQLTLYDDVTLNEVALAVKEDVDVIGDFIVRLNELNLKYVDNPDAPLDRKVVLDIVSSRGYKPVFATRPATKNKGDLSFDLFPQPPPPPEELTRRAPVVTIMGHVDHGKTTLLDALRNSQIVAHEFGGITQHIGAFSVCTALVKLPKTGDMVTFIDTPGHAAFKAMRERGARATDIVVLVVAADDGVNDQTVESIKYAAEAGVPLVVAINKCDKPGVDPKKVNYQLMKHNVVVEEMSGDVQVVEISALHRQNLDKLQEALVMQAEIMSLKSTSKGPVEGVVVESTTIQGLGKVCTLIVHRGTLRKGSVIVAGTSWGHVRTMHNEFNEVIIEAGPSCPVRVSGWHDKLPPPGEVVLQADNEGMARHVAESRAKRKKDAELVDTFKKIEEKQEEDRKKYVEIRRRKLERGMRYVSAIRRIVDTAKQYTKQPERDPKAPPEVNLILRCDVDGTLEAILDVLETYDSQMAKLDLIDFGVGPPNENIVEVADQFNSLIYCFNVPIPANVQTKAMAKNVQIKTFRVIYHLIDQLKKDLTDVLPPIVEEKIVGEGHVLRQFMVPDGFKKNQPIAGTHVDWGLFEREKKFRFYRKDRLLYEGEIESLKCGSEHVTSTGANTEVGIALPNKEVRFKEDDRVEVYDTITTYQQIDWSPPGF